MDQLELHKNLLQRLDSINIKENTTNIIGETDDIKQQINDLRESILYLSGEVQKIYKYLKAQQDKQLKNCTTVKNLIIPQQK